MVNKKTDKQIYDESQDRFMIELIDVNEGLDLKKLDDREN